MVAASASDTPTICGNLNTCAHCVGYALASANHFSCAYTAHGNVRKAIKAMPAVHGAGRASHLSFIW